MTTETSKTVSKTSKTSKTSKGPRVAKAPRSLSNGEIIRAGAFFALAGAGLAVSLPHLASEVAQLTGASVAAAWFTAIVIDCGLIATKAHLSANGPKRTVAWLVVIACTVLSIVLNAHAFLEHAKGSFGAVAAVGFGVFIPLFVLGMSYLASEIILQRRK